MKKSFVILVMVFTGMIATSFAPIVPNAGVVQGGSNDVLSNHIPPLYWDGDNDGYHRRISIANGWWGYYAQISKGYKTTTLGKDANDNNPAIH